MVYFQVFIEIGIMQTSHRNNSGANFGNANAFSSELMLSVIDQGLEVFPKNKHLSENELLGAIGTLKSTLNAIEVAKTGKIPVN